MADTDNFGSYATQEGCPSGWTLRIGLNANQGGIIDAVGDLGDKNLRIKTNPGDYGGIWLITLNAAATITDGTLEAKCKGTQISGGIDEICSIWARASAHDAFDADGYTAYIDVAADKLRLSKCSGGSETVIAQTDFTAAADTYYRVKFQLSGTSLKVRAWADAEAEPGTWNIEETDATFQDAGWAGLAITDPTTEWSWQSKFDYYSISSDVEAAGWELLNIIT